MSTTVLVVHLFLCLMKITIASSQDCRSVRSVSDFALFRHTYRLISGTGIESCAASCDADPLCYSFNYFVPTMTCELNNSSRLADSGNFLRRPRAVYLDKLKEPGDYCESFPCRNNGTCKAVRRHPGFECFCHDEFSGEKCESKTQKLRAVLSVSAYIRLQISCLCVEGIMTSCPPMIVPPLYKSGSTVFSFLLTNRPCPFTVFVGAISKISYNGLFTI